jgi:hypothetical protein
VNSATLQPPKNKNGEAASTALEEEVPDVGEEAVANEARLREAKSILIDYVAMVNKADVAKHGTTSATSR